MRDIGKYKVIGRIRTGFSEKFGVPRQCGLVPEADGHIELDVPLEALRDLDGFSHIWVIYDFDRVSEETKAFTVRPPRMEGGKVGVLASRSPHRPNPVGLSVYQVEKINGRKIYVKGVDVVDKTPVLDIKPYIKRYDSVASSTEGWLESLESFNDFDFHYEVELPPELNRIELEKVLSLDPRPRSYKKGRESALFGISFRSYNIKFFFSGNRIHILAVE